jgi:hypothetical protein
MGNTKRTAKQSAELAEIGIAGAMKIVNLSRSRIKQLASEGRIGRMIAGRYLFTAKELTEFSGQSRPSGNPEWQKK